MIEDLKNEELTFAVVHAWNQHEMPDLFHNPFA